MSTVTIALFAGIVLVLLFAGIGLLVFVLKRSKKSAAQPAWPPQGQQAAPSFPSTPPPTPPPFPGEEHGFGGAASVTGGEPTGPSSLRTQVGNQAGREEPYPSTPPSLPPTIDTGPTGTKDLMAYDTKASPVSDFGAYSPDAFATTPSATGQAGPPQAGPAPAQLRTEDGTSIPLDRAALKFGRHPDCDIVVPTPGASRQHAEIRYQDGVWIVADLNSGNGTFVNGVRIQSQPLRTGDEVRVDQSRFTFVGGA